MQRRTQKKRTVDCRLLTDCRTQQAENKKTKQQHKDADETTFQLKLARLKAVYNHRLLQ